MTNGFTVCSFCNLPARCAKPLKDGRSLCRACEPCLFFEKYLTLTGDYAGQPFLLMPWVRQVLRDIFGTLDDEGLRQFKDVYLEVGKKNNKTTLCAGLAVMALATARNSGTEVYSAATSKDQAAIVYRAACQMIAKSRPLYQRLRVIESSKKILRYDDPTIFYAAISADGDIHDGMQPSMVIRDELHRWRTRKSLELNEILERGMIARREGLAIDITTAGDANESPLCWRRHEYALQAADRGIIDKRFYGRVWSADPKRIESEPDFWKSREARVQANPSHEDNGGYLKDDVLEGLCVKAQNDPQLRAEYMRYHLNIWGQAGYRVIDMSAWLQCDGAEDLRSAAAYDPELLAMRWGLLERPCYLGVDASQTTDLTSLACVFPPVDARYTVEELRDGEAAAAQRRWIFLMFFWVPEGQVVKRERTDKKPYAEWVRRGFVETCPGNANDYEGLLARVRWAVELFDVRAMAYDPHNFRPSAMKLFEEGIPVEEVVQRYAQLSQPTKLLLGLYLDQKISHGNNPVLNWNASCLSLRSNGMDEVMPEKPDRLKSSSRIDGISAIVTALAKAQSAEPQYVTPNFLVI